MSDNYNPKQYWEQRLSNSFNLRGVGHTCFSEDYNAWLYRRKGRCIELCLRDTLLKGQNVLDVGCGTGFFVKWYLERGANVCGIDITEVSIQKLKERFSGEFLVQDITAPDYQARREFDIVNMWDVFYHIVEPIAFDQAVQNISRSIKVGGFLLFTDWFGASSDVRLANHVQMRCLGTYQQILPKVGFELVSVSTLYKTLNKTNLGSLDNYLGWLYFLIDNLSNKIPKDNLSLSVWRYSHNKRYS